jgi:hypothetical protein
MPFTGPAANPGLRQGSFLSGIFATGGVRQVCHVDRLFHLGHVPRKVTRFFRGSHCIQRASLQIPGRESIRFHPLFFSTRSTSNSSKYVSKMAARSWVRGGEQ